MVIKKGNDVIETMVYRYPQLTLTPAEGLSQEKCYQNIVRKGHLPSVLTHSYLSSPEDTLTMLQTDAGTAEVLYLQERADFETFIQILGYKGEPRPIPPSMGAITISNLNNWRKIQEHKSSWLKAGNENWQEEFRHFTADPQNYKDTLIIIGCGGYSSVSAKEAGFEENRWLEYSKTIRTYHELCHFRLKKLSKVQRDPVREEVMADAAGLYQVFCAYPAGLARKFLGIEAEEYHSGGRLENYLSEGETIASARTRAETLIQELEVYFRNKEKGEIPLETLVHHCINNRVI